MRKVLAKCMRPIRSSGWLLCLHKPGVRSREYSTSRGNLSIGCCFLTTPLQCFPKNSSPARWVFKTHPPLLMKNGKRLQWNMYPLLGRDSEHKWPSNLSSCLVMWLFPYHLFLWTCSIPRITMWKYCFHVISVSFPHASPVTTRVATAIFWNLNSSSVRKYSCDTALSLTVVWSRAVWFPLASQRM